jgi:TPR repeat protein
MKIKNCVLVPSLMLVCLSFPFLVQATEPHRNGSCYGEPPYKHKHSHLAMSGKCSESYLRGEYKKTIERWLPIAKGGDVLAQNNIGRLYERGHGVTQDRTTAFNWYKSAAVQGHRASKFKVGYLYANGEGVEKK